MKCVFALFSNFDFNTDLRHLKRQRESATALFLSLQIADLMGIRLNLTVHLADSI